MSPRKSQNKKLQRLTSEEADIKRQIYNQQERERQYKIAEVFKLLSILLPNKPTSRLAILEAAIQYIDTLEALIRSHGISLNVQQNTNIAGQPFEQLSVQPEVQSQDLNVDFSEEFLKLLNEASEPRTSKNSLPAQTNCSTAVDQPVINNINIPSSSNNQQDLHSVQVQLPVHVQCVPAPSVFNGYSALPQGFQPLLQLPALTYHVLPSLKSLKRQKQSKSSVKPQKRQKQCQSTYFITPSNGQPKFYMPNVGATNSDSMAITTPINMQQKRYILPKVASTNTGSIDITTPSSLLQNSYMSNVGATNGSSMNTL